MGLLLIKPAKLLLFYTGPDILTCLKIQAYNRAGW